MAVDHLGLNNPDTSPTVTATIDATKVNRKIDAMRESLQLLDAFEVFHTDRRIGHMISRNIFITKRLRTI